MKSAPKAIQPALIRGAVYSRSQLDSIIGNGNPHRWAKWKKAGLKPLGTGTNLEYFLSDELIELWRKMR